MNVFFSRRNLPQYLNVQHGYAPRSWRLANITNSKLKKARSVAAKEKIIGTTLGIVAVALIVSGSILAVSMSVRLIGFFVSLAGFLVMAFDYARGQNAPSRTETLSVIATASGLVFMFVFALFAPIIERIVLALEMIAIK